MERDRSPTLPPPPEGYDEPSPSYPTPSPSKPSIASSGPPGGGPPGAGPPGPRSSSSTPYKPPAINTSWRSPAAHAAFQKPITLQATSPAKPVNKLDGPPPAGFSSTRSTTSMDSRTSTSTASNPYSNKSSVSSASSVQDSPFMKTQPSESVSSYSSPARPLDVARSSAVSKSPFLAKKEESEPIPIKPKAQPRPFGQSTTVTTQNPSLSNSPPTQTRDSSPSVRPSVSAPNRKAPPRPSVLPDPITRDPSPSIGIPPPTGYNRDSSPSLPPPPGEFSTRDSSPSLPPPPDSRDNSYSFSLPPPPSSGDDFPSSTRDSSNSIMPPPPEYPEEEEMPPPPSYRESVADMPPPPAPRDSSESFALPPPEEEDPTPDPTPTSTKLSSSPNFEKRGLGGTGLSAPSPILSSAKGVSLNPKSPARPVLPGGARPSIAEMRASISISRPSTSPASPTKSLSPTSPTKPSISITTPSTTNFPKSPSTPTSSSKPSVSVTSPIPKSPSSPTPSTTSTPLNREISLNRETSLKLEDDEPPSPVQLNRPKSNPQGLRPASGAPGTATQGGQPARPAEKKRERPRFAGYDSTDLLMKQEADKYVMMGKLKEQVKDQNWIFLLSPKYLYKFPPELPHNTNTSGAGTEDTQQQRINQALSFRKKKALLDIHSVREDSDPLVFRVLSYKSKAKQTKNKVFGALGFVKSFDTFLQTRKYTVNSPIERLQWVVTLNHLIQEQWQQLCEEKMIPQGETYQRHANVMKLNRMGRAQDRVLVLSTEWLYNIECSHNPTSIRSIKWAYPIMALNGVAISYGNNDDGDVHSHSAATFYFDKERVMTGYKTNESHAYNVPKKKYEEISDSVSFFFADDVEMVNTVLELRRLYYTLKPDVRGGRPMKVEVKEKTSVIYKKENLSEKEQKLLLGNQTPSLTGTLLKYTGWGSGSHPRIVSVYPSLLVHWRESEKSKVHIGKIMSVTAGNSRSLLKKKLSDDQASRLFTIHTTNKTLQLLAVDGMERDRWIRTIQDLLSHEEMTRQQGLSVTRPGGAVEGSDLDNSTAGPVREGRARTISMSVQKPQHNKTPSISQQKQEPIQEEYPTHADESPTSPDDAEMEKQEQAIPESDPPSEASFPTSSSNNGTLLDSGGEIEPELPPPPEEEDQDLPPPEKETISDDEGYDDDD